MEKPQRRGTFYKIFMGHYKKTTQRTTLSGESELLYHVEVL